MPDSDPGSQFQKVWIIALTKYQQDTERDYFESWLGEDSPDALFRLLDEELKGCKQYQKKRVRVTNAILPILELVIVSSRTIGESLVTASPPAKAVSVAIRVLLKAAEDVSANYGTIIGTLEELKGFIGRLNVHSQQEVTEPLKKIIVDILGQLLVVLGVATKQMKQNRIAILRKKTEVTDAMEILRTLSNQEAPQTTSLHTPGTNPRLDFLVIWDRAIATYNQHTESHYLLEGGLGADSPDALFGLLDNELNSFKEYRKKGEKVRSAIAPVLNMVNVFSETVGEGLATAFPPAKAVSVAIRILLKAATDVSGNYDMIIDMFEEIKGFIGRLDVYIKQNITDKLKGVILDILAQVLVVLGVATKWIKQNRLIQYSKVLAGKNTEVTDAMGKLRMLINREIPMIAVEILHDVKNLGDNGLRKMIHSWLKPPDPTTNYNTAIEARQVGTGDWFMHREDFVEWMKAAGSFLWVHGIPGNGKTVICSTVIETLQARVDSSVALAYFYFNFNDSEKLIYRNMLHSLVFQLCKQRPGPLRDLYTRTDDGSRQPTVDELLDVLKKSVELFSDTYIVLDGLDECIGSERTAVLKFLSDIQSWDLNPLHILATSRPEQEIKEKMDTLRGGRRVDLHDTTSRINDDIQVYLDNVLQDDPHLNKWGFTEKALIRDTLVKRADGMFQWVRCQLDSLQRCFTAKELDTALRSLPKTLDETYERILKNIPDDYPEKIHRILEFLCFSERPMLLGELAEVVTVAMNSEGQAHYDSGNRMRDVSDVLTICGSLVALSASPGADDALRFEKWHSEFPLETLAARILRLSHFSVKEYLVSKRIRTGRAWNYSVDAELANRSIAITCLVYLMRFDTDELDENRMKREGDVALALYAARHWVFHFQQQDPDTHQLLQDLAHEFFHLPRRAYLLNWIRMYDLDRSGDPPKWHREANTIPDPLYYSCSAGFLDISRRLVVEGADINAQGGVYGNALQAASDHGHDSIVRLLLDGGADISAQGGAHGIALQAASYGGHLAIVRLLLDRGANINAQGQYGTALPAASLGGHEAIVRLLLDRGADIDERGYLYGTALQAASLSGHEFIVRMLLDGGADINAQGGQYGNALQAVSYGGHESIVRLLLDQGADLNAQGGQFRNALQAASACGHGAVVRLLLDGGADINAPGGEYGNALQAASYGGHETIVRLLLDGGADINAPGGHFGTALQAASDGGREAIVRLLLDRGADTNAPGGHFGTALQAASDGGRESIVRLLLDRGADVHTKGGKHGSALQAALTPRVYPPRNPLVAKILWDAGARLYTMLSEAHSEEYIARMPRVYSTMFNGTAKSADARSRRRQSWS